ncbi:oligosaccharide flippase family protein [Primorskyibacter sp. S187A]|uniref:oligosaccharide flippase family protein n=1 Tax=Primorskyibacter sp. S187A TaxID=3415130 RepID=UPI003C79A9AB
MFALNVPSGFAAQLAAYGASEAAAKASRLFVVVAVARTLDAEMIGLAAAALGAGDILKSLTENGVGQRLISAPEKDLEARAQTARRIFSVWCLGLCALQMAIGALAYLAGAPLLGGLIALLALEYLFMPAGLVEAALAMRHGKMRGVAAISGAQVVGANALTIVLALLWASPLALVLPRVLAAPIWLIAMRRLHPWHPAPGTSHAPLRPFFEFGWPVLGTELVKTCRLQADKLVVGALLGAEALGIYYMAFNAGLGLAASFTQAFSVVLFPHLCASGNRRVVLRQSLVMAALLLSPVIFAQALLAPLYVPFLLGPDWAAQAHIVSILCLAALPALVWSGVAGWLRSENRPRAELAISCALAAALIVNSMALAPFGLTAIATGYTLISTVIMLGAAFVLLSSRSAPEGALA